MSDIVLIDVEDALKRVMNNGALYANLLTKFKADKNLKTLEDSLNCGDMEKAKTAAHTLKGLAANLSLIELHKQCLEMEKQIKTDSINSNQINAVKNAFSFTLEEMDKVIAQYGK